jgi:hypothetical protein
MSAGLFQTHRVLWMPLGFAWQPASERVDHCCDTMRTALEVRCDQHDDPWECPDVAVVYHEAFDEFGIPIRDGGMSYLLIEHCPWCGLRLPEPQRDRWFETLEAADVDPGDLDKLPKQFLSAAWRIQPS